MLKAITNTDNETIIINTDHIDTIKLAQSGAWGIRLESGIMVFISADELDELEVE